MIERYFITGLRLRWTFPGADASGVKDGSIIANPNRAAAPMVYDGMDGTLYDTFAPHVSTLGLTKGMQIPYSWLMYVLGHTSKKMLAGGDVLTGFMSGCPIALWTETGYRYVGHIGTVEENDTMNKRVKRAFAAYMPRDTTGFFPAAAWPPNERVAKAENFARQRIAADPKILALVTTTGEFFSILIFKIGMPTDNTWCIGGIKKVPPMNYAALRQALNPTVFGAHRGL